MFLGSRRIRSAGQRSGSVEITLPVALHPFQGIECAIQLRDGLQPEIVLVPEVQTLLARPATLWRLLATTLGRAPTSLPLGQVNLALVTPDPWPPVPTLCFSDCQAVETQADTPALARLLTGVAQALAVSNGATETDARRFGAAVCQVMLGLSARLGEDAAAAALVREVAAEPPTDGQSLPPSLPMDVFTEAPWRARAAWLSEIEFRTLGALPGTGEASAPPRKTPAQRPALAADASPGTRRTEPTDL